MSASAITTQPAPAVTPVDRMQQILQTLGKAYLQRQQYAEAYEKYRELMLLGVDTAEVMIDAAVAALGMKNVSDEALALYEKALEQKPDYDPLRLGLPVLFAEREITTPFAISLCEKTAEFAAENETRIRLHLKKHYEASGLFEKAQLEEQKAVFSNRDHKTIRDYLEKLWWEDKFPKAHAALHSAMSRNGNEAHLVRELALTHAYEHLVSGVVNEEVKTLAPTLMALSHLAPDQSLQDFGDYLVLRSALPDGDLAQYFAASKLDAGRLPIDRPPLAAIFGSAGKNQQSKYLVGGFDVRREVIELLKKPEEDKDAQRSAVADSEGILMVQVLNLQGLEVPEKVLALLNTHLLQLPDSFLRMAGTTFVSVAKDSQMQIRAMIDFMQSLEEYNSVAPEAERFTVVGSLQLARPIGKSDHRSVLQAFIECWHLLRHAMRSVNSEAGAGILLVHADESRLLKLKSSGVNLIFMDRLRLLPGKDFSCAELIWRNPLAQLKDGQVYEFGRYAIYKRLLKHSNYGTYLANDVELDRPTAMKIVLTQEVAQFRQKDDLRGMLFERIRAIARLSHPYLAHIHDMGERDGVLYIAREYIEGKELSDVTFNEEHRDGEILVLMQKIVRALIYAKSKGVAHLNMKPGNIWLSEAQDLRITDFRIPGFTEDPTTTSVLVPAQWRYAAPEILLGEPGDSRSDIYSVGVIAYELIAGRHPYATANTIHSPHDILKVRITPLAECDKPHHRGWDKFVMQAIQRHADKRFQNLEEVDNELRSIQIEMLQRDLNGR